MVHQRTNKSFQRVDSGAALIYHDPASMILIDTDQTHTATTIKLVNNVLNTKVTEDKIRHRPL